MSSSRLRMLLFSSMMAAVTAILAQVEIPLPLVPISGQTLAVGIAATILGSRYGAFAMIIYMLLGITGLPVFAGFAGGAHVVAGPTGGYIVGFIAAAYLTGLFLEKTSFTIKMAIIANLIGMIVTLTFGAIWLKVLLDMSWPAAMAAGVYPFLVVGVIKALLAAWIGIAVRNRLGSSQMRFGEAA
ncbi:biotin transporter BioY [Jeotgalibacillus sp. R-1-5s-1]|uniref:biotin transporter BioY n=1 Tax=Jeotgalibacillus sp. R-1-5s-1 TaxID=2555897 RepID=UPI00106CB92A|nr:biotin transporter BioY [Jeotgalibacillus sp. R-1-5s-1]TFE00016.1 biotin transporter BioY [Jeotgalibacillus sp. R-1-5s-1]